MVVAKKTPPQQEEGNEESNEELPEAATLKNEPAKAESKLESKNEETYLTFRQIEEISANAAAEAVKAVTRPPAAKAESKEVSDEPIIPKVSKPRWVERFMGWN